MALDKMMLDPLMAGYKFYIDDLDNKNIKGTDYDTIVSLIERVKQIAEQVDAYDMATVYAKIQEENIQTKMTEAYTRALSGSSASANGGAAYDDNSLLRQNLDALRNAIGTIRKSYTQMLDNAADKATKMEIEALQNPEPSIKKIEEAIALGEQPGMTYPMFLYQLVAQGLDKAVEGHALQRPMLEQQLKSQKALMATPLSIARAEEKLQEYNKLASQNQFNLVEIHEWELVSDSIDRKYAPLMAKSSAKYNLFKKIIDFLDDWSLSYCPFAPDIAPWNVIGDPQRSRENVRRSQNTDPGLLAEYEKLLAKYFGLRLKDVIADEVFINEVKSNAIVGSQELLEYLLVDVYPHCKPFNQLPQDLIDKRSDMYRGKREVNPEANAPALRLRDYLDSVYGAGYYDSKNAQYGPIKPVESNAAKWDFDAFASSISQKMN